jgi:hypothetical protein
LAGGGKHDHHVFAPVRWVAARERSDPDGPTGLSFRLRPSNPPRPSGRNPHRPLIFFWDLQGGGTLGNGCSADYGGRTEDRRLWRLGCNGLRRDRLVVGQKAARALRFSGRAGMPVTKLRRAGRRRGHGMPCPYNGSEESEKRRHGSEDPPLQRRVCGPLRAARRDE